MRCPNCGSEIPEGYMNCPKCGSMILGNTNNRTENKKSGYHDLTSNSWTKDAKEKNNQVWIALGCSLLPYICGTACVVEFHIIWIVLAIVFAFVTLVMCKEHQEGYYRVAKNLAILAFIILGIFFACIIGYSIYEQWYDNLPWYEKLDY